MLVDRVTVLKAMSDQTVYACGIVALHICLSLTEVACYENVQVGAFLSSTNFVVN